MVFCCVKTIILIVFEQFNCIPLKKTSYPLLDTKSFYGVIQLCNQIFLLTWATGTLKKPLVPSPWLTLAYCAASFSIFSSGSAAFWRISSPRLTSGCIVSSASFTPSRRTIFIFGQNCLCPTE